MDKPVVLSSIVIAVCVLVIAGAGYVVIRAGQTDTQRQHQVDRQYASLIHDVQTLR